VSQLGLHEDETHEFKEIWTARALEDLAAFANHRGGTLWVGVNDEGNAVGFALDDAEYQKIANQIVDVLGLRPSMHWETVEGHPVLLVTVAPAGMPVSCRGRYLTRVGSTNRDMSPEQWSRRALAQTGQTWDRLLSDRRIADVDEELVQRFVRLARPRLPQASEEDDVERILQNLELAQDGRLTNAAVLLFTSKPQRLFPLAQARVGRFRGSQILDSHDFAGSLWEQVDGVMDRFRSLLDVRFEVRSQEASLEGIQRQEIWEYPLDALREALLNALSHRDYTVTADVQIRVYDDQLSIWSPGELPQDLEPEQLYQPRHPSVLRNPLVAQVFYYAGFIERWGSGTTRILELCAGQGLPQPRFEEYSGGVNVTFYQDAYTPTQLQKRGFNERQIQAVLYVKEQGRITASEYQELTGASRSTLRRDLDALVQENILIREGKTGRGTFYRINASNAP